MYESERACIIERKGGIMKTGRIEIGPYKVKLYIPEGADTVVYIWEAEDITSPAEELAAKYNASLAYVSGFDWNRDLSPWKAPKVFGGEEDFSGGADDFISLFRTELLPLVEKEMPGISKRFLAGVSLAGLCGVYAGYKTDIFSGIAAVSGSLWFDGFMEYMKNNSMNPVVKRVYLSLGSREKRVRNPRMAKIGACMEEAVEILNGHGVETVLQVNPGDHFADGEWRLEKAVCWLLTGTLLPSYKVK